MNNSAALIGVILILIGSFLSGGKMFAKYSGTELVGFEEKSTFKNEKVKTFGLILFIRPLA